MNSPYRELFVVGLIESESNREQREREASDFLERVGVFARGLSASVVAAHPIDFHAVVAALNIRVQHGEAPTPHSLRYQFFTVHTHRGCVDVVSDPDAPRGMLRRAPFSGVLPSGANDPARAEQEGKGDGH